MFSTFLLSATLYSVQPVGIHIDRDEILFDSYIHTEIDADIRFYDSLECDRICTLPMETFVTVEPRTSSARWLYNHKNPIITEGGQKCRLHTVYEDIKDADSRKSIYSGYFLLND